MDIGYLQVWDTPKYVEWQEITTMAVVLHYAEAVMTRYNTDGGDTLNNGEVWNAYATFSGYISVLAEERCRENFNEPMQDFENSRQSIPVNEATIAPNLAPESAWGDAKTWLRHWIRDHGC